MELETPASAGDPGLPSKEHASNILRVRVSGGSPAVTGWIGSHDSLSLPSEIRMINSSSLQKTFFLSLSNPYLHKGGQGLASIS